MALQDVYERQRVAVRGRSSAALGKEHMTPVYSANAKLLASWVLTSISLTLLSRSIKSYLASVMLYVFQLSNGLSPTHPELAGRGDAVVRHHVSGITDK